MLYLAVSIDTIYLFKTLNTVPRTKFYLPVDLMENLPARNREQSLATLNSCASLSLPW